MSIYRYQKINEQNLTAWANNQLWFSGISELDDGFEMWWKPDAVKFENGLKEKIDNYLENYRIQLIKKLALCCFSKREDIALMWAHYGDGLRGICFEYDKNNLILNGALLKPEKDFYFVDYPPTVNLPCPDIFKCYQEQNFSEAEKALIATKSKDWKYQEEIRLLWRQQEDVSKGLLVDVDRQAIKSIIFGERVRSDQVKLVKDIFGTSMMYKSAKRSKTLYEIEIIDHHPSP